MSKFLKYIDNEEMGIKSTDKTPFVWFRNSGELTIKGRSIPEDGVEFFAEILDWILTYANEPCPSTVLTIELEYLNDITAKYLLQIINTLNNACEQFKVVWRFEKDDDDTLEIGQILCSSSGCDFEFISYESGR
jgi:hypothetical protein